MNIAGPLIAIGLTLIWLSLFKGPPPGAFVYAALTLDKLREAVRIELKLRSVSKCSRPFALGLGVHYSSIRYTKNDNSERLLDSHFVAAPGYGERVK